MILKLFLEKNLMNIDFFPVISAVCQIIINCFFETHEYPKVFIFHINRFFTSINYGLVKYQLFGCIEHHGVCVNRGHYTCTIRNDANWYYCNDYNI